MQRNNDRRRLTNHSVITGHEGASSSGWRSRRPHSEPCAGDKKYDTPKNESKNRMPPKKGSLSKFSFKFIESLLDKPVEEVINRFSQNVHFFQHIGTKLSPDNVVVILKLLGRFCDFSFQTLRRDILHKSLTSGFVDQLQSYISNLAFQSDKEKRFNAYYWKDPDSFWGDLMKICDVTMNENPHFFVDNLLKLTKISLLNIPQIEAEHNIHICDDISDNLKSLIDKAEKIKEESPKIAVNTGKKFMDNSEEEPPEDFHEISIFPTTFELVHTTKPFLRKNVVIGPYRNVDHYLDVQFRLLREDFVGPLRIGIQGFLSGKNYRDIEYIKIHPKVQFLNTIVLTEDYCVLLKFHFSSKLLNFKYENSKKFMYGSLVCFTNDNFKSILFGRIADRKIENLKNGELVVGFSKAEELMFHSDYIMVECSIYFEPYNHVLNVLKQIREEDFPMKNYIVDVDRNILRPDYANPLVSLEIVCNKKKEYCNLFQPGFHYIFDDLNKSQNEAFVAALSRQLSIIQGPPGTGKTYVGLKIARTLLKNSSYWYKNSPILVICFTNHALDQFLEGLIGTTDKIMRLGGQSKNEKLDKFNMRKQAYKMSPAVWNARAEVSKLLNCIKNVTDTLKCIRNNDCILDFHQFFNVIPNYYHSWIAKATSKEFLEWLLAENAPTHQSNIKHSSLIEQFDKMEIEHSEDEEDEDHEKSELEELLNFMEPNIQSSLIDLKELNKEILNNIFHLKKLEAQLEDNEEHIFEYASLKNNIERLENLQIFLKQKLSMAPKDTTEKPVIDIRNSKYIPLNERWNLYFYWLNLYREDLLKKYEEYNSEYRKAVEIYNELKEMGNVEILKSMELIGMTTTSAARLHSSLQLLKCPIVIVEEAAEVLEAHIISALTKNCQQLILIGDHQQLRPNTANYKLDKHYHLGISMFERMVRNEIQCFTLNIQHRMRPEISSLIKPSIYPNLKDHESVFDRPLIDGVDKCLYFIDHEIPEDSHDENSKKNVHEAKFLVQLARYLILNGYKSHQITILAAYLGQMFEMQKEKKKIDLLKDVRISVLDNYQGEESDIILLSLVRNNKFNKIGFLSIENRVCVALSRARNGLYIMGNMSLLCNNSKLWVEIKETLLSQEAIGNSLSLKCQNHKKITSVSNSIHFSSVSEGGCDQICNNSLVCGHKCKMQCHALDKDHEHYICREKCNRLLCDSNLTHICRKRCGEECGPCDYPKNVRLDCGHDAVILCHMIPEDYKCPTKVEVTLPCGHEAIKPCYIETTKHKCQVPCDARLDCGHSCWKFCHVFDDPDHLLLKCLKPCAKFRDGCTDLKNDSHKCQKLCHQVCEPCRIPVRKARSVCTHWFDVPCSENVDDIVCNKPCKKKLNCEHPCKNTCSVPCNTCTVKVKKQIPECNHTVTLPCNVEAVRKLCNKNCSRVMDCGHKCDGKCRDDCDVYKCKKIVTVAIQSKCGHVVKEVPCFLKTLYKSQGESSVKNLESYCTEPCTAILNCSTEEKHSCSGTCGSCYQGRMHKRCSMKCSRILICDHECTGYCRETCKPCLKKCSFKCKHSNCKKRCGDQCIKCNEPCSRRCEHQNCTKKCGEICNVPPCEAPCKKKLRCNHPCIGFCSEPCPKLCRICTKNEVEELFFGTEDEEDARFVLLNDCGHIVENSGMKQWLKQDQESIKFKVCPKCKTNIFTTERYSDYIKKSFEAISAAKIIGIGTKETIEKKRLELIDKLDTLCVSVNAPLVPRKIILNHHQKLKCRLQKVDGGRVQHFNLVELNAIEIKYQLMEQVLKILAIKESNNVSVHQSSSIEIQVDLILTYLLREVDDITSPEVEDTQREINRLHRMVQVLPLLDRLRYENKNLNEGIINVNNLINSLSKYDDEKDGIVKKELSRLRKQHHLLDITDLEKQQIVKAIGLSKGHWYQCPNGHPYAIGECGGAMQISRCPDCGVQIGGQSHRLLDQNRVATFMDGAAYPAWSEEQNMMNYEF